METLILIGVLAAFATLGWRMYRQYLRRHRIWTLGHRYALPVGETHTFSFSARFLEHAMAADCRARVNYPGLAGKIEGSKNNEFWVVTWEISMPARRKAFDDILHRLHTAIDEVGSTTNTVICTSSLPGSGTGFVLHAT